jgi:periplasmic protein TonB
MASLAHLNREERIGLGVAAVAHVALVAALVWQVRDDPTALPIPERMTVSLADEVSLESTAPNPSDESQAAVAPVLSPEPAPVAEPREVARQQVRPTPRQTAIPRPTPRQTPRPAQTQRAGGSRIGDDFLEGAGNSERSNNRGAPAVTFGAAEAASLNQAIARELRPHWSAPQGVDAEKLITIVRFRLNADGSLAGSPSCIRQSGETPSNAAQKGLHCERAIRAVRLAAPFDLPDQFYDKWKLVDSTFDRRL